jgi:hypothetical protein
MRLLMKDMKVDKSPCRWLTELYHASVTMKELFEALREGIRPDWWPKDRAAEAALTRKLS